MKRLKSILKRKLIVIPSLTALIIATVILLPANVSMAIESHVSVALESIEGGTPPQQPIEVISKRDRTSKTHWSGGNLYDLDVSISPIHYQDDLGDWQEIDCEFSPSVAPWDWEMTKAGYTVKVLEDFTFGQIIEVEKEDYTLYFQPMNLEWTNDLDQIQLVNEPQSVAVNVTNSIVDLLPAVGMLSNEGKIRWDDAYGSNINFEWTCQASRLSKLLIVENFNDLPTVEQFIIDGVNPVLRLNLIFDAHADLDIVFDNQSWDRKSTVQSYDIIRFKTNGEALFGFMPLKYWDSSDNDTGISIATLEKRGNKLYTSIRVPYGWIQDAVFPIYIDTDVDVQVGASSDDASQKGNGSTSITYIRQVMGDYASYQYSGQRFSSVTIASSATINTANLTWEAQAADSGSFEGFLWGEDVANPLTYTTDAFNITNRTRTSTSVACGSAELGSWNINTEYSSPEIKTIIQELVDTHDYSTGAPLNIVWWYSGIDTGERLGKTYDGATTKAPKLHIEYTSVGCSENISNSPDLINFGIVSPSSIYYSNGGTPTFPLDDGECYFTLTNNSGGAITCTASSTNFTGGIGWVISSSTGENIVVLKAGESGDDEGDLITLSGSEQELISSLADSGTRKWELRLETGTFTDPDEKSATVTITAVCP